jgi:Spy/CpxP family protein refolding chaperone
MRHVKPTVFAACLMVLLMTPVLYAGYGCCGGGQGFGPGGKGGFALGDLSKEQQEKVNALRIDLLKKQEATRSDLAKKRIEFMELNSKENPDESALQKKREEMWALQDQMRNERRSFQTSVRALLTPEQRAKLGGFGPGGNCPMGFGGCGAGRGPGRGAGCCRGAGGWQGGAGPQSM